MKQQANLPARGGFKLLRILILLLVLLIVALSTWQDRYRSTRWREPLYVAVYPIAADESPVTLGYVAALDAERFKPIDRFFMREAGRYRLTADEPVKTRLRSELHDRRRSARRMQACSRLPGGACGFATGRGGPAAM